MGKVEIGRNSLKQAVVETVNEFFNRDTMDSFKSLGIKDPSDEYTVDEQELKNTCSIFLQKCGEFKVILDKFYGYIDGVEADEENGVQAVQGVRSTMRGRNMFGARNIHDEFLEEDLNNLEGALWQLKSNLEEAMESVDTIVQ